MNTFIDEDGFMILEPSTPGERLIYFREKRGFTQQEAAEPLFIARETLSMYESDKRPIPLDRLVQIAKFYGVTPNHILIHHDYTNHFMKEINSDINQEIHEIFVEVESREFEEFVVELVKSAAYIFTWKGPPKENK